MIAQLFLLKVRRQRNGTIAICIYRSALAHIKILAIKGLFHKVRAGYHMGLVTKAVWLLRGQAVKNQRRLSRLSGELRTSDQTADSSSPQVSGLLMFTHSGLPTITACVFPTIPSVALNTF